VSTSASWQLQRGTQIDEDDETGEKPVTIRCCDKSRHMWSHTPTVKV